MHELLGVSEISRMLGLPRSTAYRLLKSGALPTVRFGRLVRVDRGALEAWVRAHTTTAVESDRGRLRKRP